MYEIVFFLISGTKITFENEGDEESRYTIAGDIVFIIRDKPHPIFERSNSDLIYRVKLTLKQALLGTAIIIPFLDSSKPTYQLRTNHDIITPQTEKRFPNEGLPYPKDPTKRGDLIVKFDILFPKFLNNEQRTLAEKCFANSIDFYQPHDSVLHTTIIDQNQKQQQQTPTEHQSSSIPTPLKPQTSSPNPTNHNNHHQRSPHRYFNNNNTRHKSPAPPSNNTNQTKSTSVRISPPVPPRTSTAGLHADKTVF